MHKTLRSFSGNTYLKCDFDFDNVRAIVYAKAPLHIAPIQQIDLQDEDLVAPRVCKAWILPECFNPQTGENKHTYVACVKTGNIFPAYYEALEGSESTLEAIQLEGAKARAGRLAALPPLILSRIFNLAVQDELNLRRATKFFRPYPHATKQAELDPETEIKELRGVLFGRIVPILARLTMEQPKFISSCAETLLSLRLTCRWLNNEIVHYQRTRFAYIFNEADELLNFLNGIERRWTLLKDQRTFFRTIIIDASMTGESDECPRLRLKGCMTASLPGHDCLPANLGKNEQAWDRFFMQLALRAPLQRVVPKYNPLLRGANFLSLWLGLLQMLLERYEVATLVVRYSPGDVVADCVAPGPMQTIPLAEYRPLGRPIGTRGCQMARSVLEKRDKNGTILVLENVGGWKQKSE